MPNPAADLCETHRLLRSHVRSRGLQRGLARLSNGLELDRLQFHVNARDMQRIYCRAK